MKRMHRVIFLRNLEINLRIYLIYLHTYLFHINITAIRILKKINTRYAIGILQRILQEDIN